MSRSSAIASSPLAGRYALGEVIGRGGMGVVYRATDRVLKRTVAVKVLSPALSTEDSTHVLRFEREARAAAALSNRAVVRVFDAGADEDARFIVMEYVHGRSLAAMLRDDGPLGPRVAAGIGADVATALAAAHAHGIVHRDIKPGNVIVTDDGAAKVLDFGIARALDATAITRTATVLGSAAYMSPEQVEGQPADARSDIYSLGCVLYEMVSGRPPFTAESVAAIFNQHVSANAPPPSQSDGRVPSALDALVMQMLEKDPAARPASAAEVRARLCKADGRDPREARGVAPAIAPAPRPPTAAPTPTAKLHATAVTRASPVADRGRRRRYAWVALALASVVAIALMLLATSGGSRPRAHSSRRVARATTAVATRRVSTPAPKTQPPAKTTPPATPTVASLAGALIGLVGQDAQAGQIQPPAAQQLTTQVGDLLNAYDTGNTADAAHKLTELLSELAKLEQQGLVAPTAAAAVAADLSRIGETLPATQTPPATPAPPAAAGAGDNGAAAQQPPQGDHKPPGHDGAAKGKAGKQD